MQRLNIWGSFHIYMLNLPLPPKAAWFLTGLSKVFFKVAIIWRLNSSYIVSIWIPPWQQKIFSSTMAAMGRQLKQSVKVFHSLMLNLRLPVTSTRQCQHDHIRLFQRFSSSASSLIDLRQSSLHWKTQTIFDFYWFTSARQPRAVLASQQICLQQQHFSIAMLKSFHRQVVPSFLHLGKRTTVLKEIWDLNVHFTQNL